MEKMTSRRVSSVVPDWQEVDRARCCALCGWSKGFATALYRFLVSPDSTLHVVRESGDLEVVTHRPEGRGLAVPLVVDRRELLPEEGKTLPLPKGEEEVDQYGNVLDDEW